MEMKRRQFLGTAAVGTGALLAGHVSSGAAQNGSNNPKGKPAKPVSSDPVSLVPLTKDIWCSRIGFGTGMRGLQRQSDLTRLGRETAVELVRFAYDLGIRFYDGADLYGSHQILSEALQDKPRDSYTLLSKIWVHRGGIPEQERPTADVVVKRFLKEFRTDYLDVVQLHCMMNGDWVQEYSSYMESLEKLKEQGLIRAHGVSCHANAALRVAAETPWTDVVHIRINPEGAKMDGSVEDVVDVAKKVHAAGIGTIAMKVIGEGTFKDNLQLRRKSAHFVANLDCIDVMIVGFDKKEQVTEFIENVANALKKA